MRIALLANDIPEANVIAQRILSDHRHQVVGILRSNTVLPKRSAPGEMLQLVRHMGPRYLAFRGLQLGLTQLCRNTASMLRKPPQVNSLPRMAADRGIPCETVRRVNGDRAKRVVASWQPDLLVVIYIHQIVKPSLLEIAPGGAINVHPSLLPTNRGPFPNAWALAERHERTGVTIHRIDPRIDNGPILQQRELRINQDESLVSLEYRSAVVGGELISQTIDELCHGLAVEKPQASAEATYRSWPDRRTFAAIARLGSPLQTCKLYCQAEEVRSNREHQGALY